LYIFQFAAMSGLRIGLTVSHPGGIAGKGMGWGGKGQMGN